MILLGLGLDVVDIQMMAEKCFGNPLGGFRENNFTEGEIRYAQEHYPKNPIESLSVRWAAKEAFIKALDMANLGHERLIPQVNNHDIEIVSDSQNRPSIVLYRQVKQVATQLGVKRVSLSLSHDGNYGAAVVILEG